MAKSEVDHTDMLVCERFSWQCFEEKISDDRDVSQATARKARRKIMAENKVNEAAGVLVNSLRETNQAVMENIVAVQEHNMKFVQSIFTDGMEDLRSQAESTRTLMQALGRQTQKQQEAFQRLAYAWVDLSFDFLRVPLAFSQQAVEAPKTATQ